MVARESPGGTASSSDTAMTRRPGKYPNLILQKLVLIAAFASAVAGTSQQAVKLCASALISSCADCLQQHPDCAWCFQQGFLEGAVVSMRCGTITTLQARGCELQFIERQVTRATMNATASGTQVSPQEVTLHLQPGSEVSFLVQVRQLQVYPVDMYYLVDVSASMQDHLDRLRSVGVALSQRMRSHSSDFRVGFGSFVDKPMSPYINVHPSKIHNPCSDYGVQCRPAHGFLHVLRLTENTTEFTRVIQAQRISGNMDTPEGGLDAMLQVAVCQGDIGWRADAKRLLLVMTDQPSHLALDSKLAGIVVPHDGKCHLENNTYTHSTLMEHPSVGLLAEELLQGSIYSIFAVEQMQYKWYEELVSLLPGAHLGRLQPKAANLKDLVVEAYKKLLSQVEVRVGIQDKHAHMFSLNVSAHCPEASKNTARSRCSNVRPNQTVVFNISVSMSSCPSEREVLGFVRPVGFNESTVVRVRPACACRCGDQQHCGDELRRSEPNQANCSTVQAPDCRVGGDGGAGHHCSGRGRCVCGKCLCYTSRFGLIHGKYCQLDDFSCPRQHGLICAGTFCEKCPTCTGACQSHWKCVQCHLSSGLAEGNPSACNGSCPLLVEYVHDISEAKGERSASCLYPVDQRCHYRFHMDVGPKPTLVWISSRPECAEVQHYLPTFVLVFLLTFLLGLVFLATLSCLLQRWSRAPDESKRAVYAVTKEDTLRMAAAIERAGPCREQPLELRLHQLHNTAKSLHEVRWQ
ncbi:hypothetical protein AGOR_G00045560 [Albula goreensis]|uniref:Integrin beta n=1 Tax=Albula goreensis TaxID=1534307 RepID=A0A8T3E2N4_9TELE|nr:hypothetical protein AGOR_G00045560 [Albula goreensis]